MGKLEARQRLTVVRRLCGHDSMGPSGVLAQSFDLTKRPISPPPTSQSFESTDSPSPGTLVPQAGPPRMSGKFSSEVSVAVAMTWAFRIRSSVCLREDHPDPHVRVRSFAESSNRGIQQVWGRQISEHPID